MGDYKLTNNPDCDDNVEGIRFGGLQPFKKCSARKFSRKASKVIKHEDYDNVKFINDIALLRLDQAVELHDENQYLSAATPICLPWNKDNPARNLIEGDEALVTGWGRIAKNSQNEINRAESDLLMKETVSIITDDYGCWASDLNTEKQICATSIEG